MNPTPTATAADMAINASLALAALIVFASILTLGFGLLFAVFLYPVYFWGMAAGSALHGIDAYQARGKKAAVSSAWAVILWVLCVLLVIAAIVYEAGHYNLSLGGLFSEPTNTVVAISLVFIWLHILLFSLFAWLLTGWVNFRLKWLKYVLLATLANPYLWMLIIIGGADLVSDVGFGWVFLPLGIILVIVAGWWSPEVYSKWFRQMAEDLA